MMSDIAAVKKKMSKRVESLKLDYGRMRTGRANISLLDDISVEQYGAQTPIKQIASLSTPEARTIAIQPWDATSIKDIERAIQKSDLDINPVNDGKIIRIVLPVMTEERRKELVKKVKKAAEDCKVSVRNIRRDANESSKKQEKSKDISEDECHKVINDVQKITDDFVKNIDEIMHKKEKDVMEI